MKNPQSLSAHNMKIHTVLLTPLQKACNPCESWFPTVEEAVQHHSTHGGDSLPYTCSRCYDNFVDIPSYDRHFANSCISTYEVPDVTCDECWRSYATYKLLEEHRCPGEAARPGGNCSKCDKKYLLLRNQIIHEMKCKGRKSGEPVEAHHTDDKMLPMEVRIVRCDHLLKKSEQGSYNVANISQTFGLDRNHTYPYFYAKDLKMEPLNSSSHMVAIQDEIKEEILQQNHVNWDSDDKEKSEEENLPNNSKSKTVEALSTLSLKTLFSRKCLGKVPKKNEAEKPFDMNVHFSDDIRRNIDTIISHLGKESQSDGYDLDSTLDKSQKNINNSALDLFDRLKTSNDPSENKDNHESNSVFTEKDTNISKTTNESRKQNTLNEDLDSFNKSTRNNIDESKSNAVCTQISKTDCSKVKVDTDVADVSHVNSIEDSFRKSDGVALDISNKLERHSTKIEERHLDSSTKMKNVDHSSNEEEKSTNYMINGDSFLIENDDGSQEENKSTQVEKTEAIDIHLETVENNDFTNNVQNNISLKLKLDVENNENNIKENNEVDGKLDASNRINVEKVSSAVTYNTHRNSVDMIDEQNKVGDINGDTLSLDSLKYTSENYAMDKCTANTELFNSDDFNDDTKKLMDEIDAQIGEN